jgi:hypothetical protein
LLRDRALLHPWFPAGTRYTHARHLCLQRALVQVSFVSCCTALRAWVWLGQVVAPPTLALRGRVEALLCWIVDLWVS